MICNVVDRRTNSYNVSCDVAFEPSQHDNSIPGATQFDWGSGLFFYNELFNTTIVQAIEHANKFNCSTTMYIYDVGVLQDGTNINVL